MAYKTKPRFLKAGSLMTDVLGVISEEASNLDEFDVTARKDAIYPAARHGLVKITKSGDVRITKSGSKLLTSVK